MQAPVRAVTQPPLGFRREIVEALDPLHDVAVVTSHDDVPAALGRDLGAHPLADDPLVPQVVGATVRPHAVGNHVGMEVVSILMGGQDVLVIFHPDRFQQPLRIADDLLASRPFVFGVRDDQVVDRVVAARRKGGDRFHLDRRRFDRRDPAQYAPKRLSPARWHRPRRSRTCGRRPPPLADVCAR